MRKHRDNELKHYLTLKIICTLNHNNDNNSNNKKVQNLSYPYQNHNV